MLTGALDSEDTRVMIEALRRLGLAVRARLRRRRRSASAGCGGRLPVAEADLFVANSGTTMRFLTAMLALGQGTFRLDGTPRMRERPMQTCSTPCGSLAPMPVSRDSATAVRRCGPGGRACRAARPPWPATSPASSSAGC